MLAHTTITLGAKVAKELDIGIQKVVIASGDHILGKIKDRDDTLTPPALSIFRTSLAVNRESGTRVFRERSGIPVQKGDRTALVLYTIPVLAGYSLSLIVPDVDVLDKAEANLLWFVEDEEKTQLPIRVTLDGEEVDLPGIQVTPETAGGASLSRSRQEEWEGGRLYKIDFDLSVNTYIVKSEINPVIRTIGLRYTLQETEILLADIVIGEE